MPAVRPFAPSSGGPGPYLEGGDIICFQNHLFVGESDIATNRAGTDWLSDYITPFGYQVHPMPMHGSILHLLGTMVLVADGVLLLYRDELNCDLPAPLADWDVIDLTEEEARAYATVGVSLDDKRYVDYIGHGRDGGFPDGNVVFDFIAEEKINIFGTSAKFIDAIAKAGLRPAQTHDLSNVRTILSTGSPHLLLNRDFVLNPDQIYIRKDAQYGKPYLDCLQGFE